MTLFTEHDQPMQQALDKIGQIRPWWCGEEKTYVFEHPAYPDVQCAHPDIEQVRLGYIKALHLFLRKPQPASVQESGGSNRGGHRPGAGRPRKSPTTQVRVPMEIMDIIHWLKEDPSRATQIRPLINR